MASVLVRAPKTASNRAQLLGRLDRLGQGIEALTETDDELIAFLRDYSGSEEEARAHFGEDADLEYNAFTNRPPKASDAAASGQFEPFVEIAEGVVLSRSAADREGPPAPPEVQPTAGGTSPDEGGAPDTEDKPSPHLSGAAQAQATADKKAAKAKK